MWPENIIKRLRRPFVAFLHDLIVVPAAWLGAYWLRFNLEALPQDYLVSALSLLPAVWLIQGAAFWYFGLYRGVWRFASMPDLVRIVKAVVVGTATSAAAVFLLTRLQGVPRSVFVLDAVLLVLFLGGPRFAYRWLRDRRLSLAKGERTLIVGAGRAGEMLVRDMLREAAGGFYPVAFVDDDPAKQGREIHGVRVAGGCEAIPALVQRLDIARIVIALPSANSRQLRRIVELCERAGVPFQTLPSLQDLASGKVGLRELREVRIEDLLGRDPVRLDWDAIAAQLSGRVVLVTGAGGSIGAELCRQLARLQPARLVLFEQSEYNLYTIEHELRRLYPMLALSGVLGDVTDRVAVEGAFETHRPEVVFHAAAYKHVPILEGQVRAAVRNNVFGTRLVAEVADRHGCDIFVLISTDKAVNPANVMGVTKRVAEMICEDLAGRSRTKYITVRFGNVLGSSGSVVPLFREQIARGGPVTVTHPEITRYFMTIPEACQLILQAAVQGRGGEIFVLDMGEPVKIAYLAEQMIRLSGKTPGEDIEIVYTGLRPGEKLYEELFHERENLTPGGHPKLLVAHPRRLEPAVLAEGLEALARLVETADEPGLRAVLLRLVPEQAATNDASQLANPASTIVYH
jgi:FlaA1/EpsC-like NDP-sugar epimerase